MLNELRLPGAQNLQQREQNSSVSTRTKRRALIWFLKTGNIILLGMHVALALSATAEKDLGKRGLALGMYFCGHHFQKTAHLKGM